MASKRYPPEIIAQAKRFFIYEGWGFEKISEFFDGSPHAKTISNWAEEKDPDGKTWYDLRKEYTESIVHAVTPEMIEQKYQQRIYEELTDPNWSNKNSDSLAKLQVQFAKITDPARQIPVMYSFLTQLVQYMKKYHPDLVTKELLQAVTDFKNLKRNEFYENN